ncbi:MAG TPA: hypothetical protein ENF26_05200 [Methanomicrobia archaeon]|nr:hypothetical protein [Methanomicrobia archaeon]HEX59523.1 hypothetical protein [Methanomicrobia archaeon]
MASLFEKFLYRDKAHCRKSEPSTNVEVKMEYFEASNEFVEWYNNKPHMSWMSWGLFLDFSEKTPT